MSVFNKEYARYYDLLYADKDYRAEAGYVASLIRAHRPNATRVLELGCGTGKHAVLLAEDGFQVHGVDRSEQMIALAEKHAINNQKLSFSVGDVTSYDSKGKFDAIVSLFHVVSYQTSNNDLCNMFRLAAAQLEKGGVFVFDIWYGPAVLTQSLSVRVKRFEDDECAITRIAEPFHEENRNTVEVKYTIISINKKNHWATEFKESHLMRYLFRPELEFLLDNAGLRLVTSEEWLTRNVPSMKTWSVCFVAIKDD